MTFVKMWMLTFYLAGSYSHGVSTVGPYDSAPACYEAVTELEQAFPSFIVRSHCFQVSYPVRQP